MYNLESLPEQIKKIEEIYLSTQADNASDKLLDDFYIEFITPFEDKDTAKLFQSVTQLERTYKLDEVDSDFYWTVIDTFDLKKEPEEKYDTVFHEFLLFMSYFCTLNKDPDCIAIKRLMEGDLEGDFFWDFEILDNLLTYALEHIYSEDDRVIGWVSKYKDKKQIKLLGLLFTVLNYKNSLAVRIKGAIFDIVVALKNDGSHVFKRDLLSELYYEPILGQWFHLLNEGSQNKIRELLKKSSNRVFTNFIIDNKSSLEQYSLEHNLNLELNKTNRFNPLQFSNLEQKVETYKRYTVKIGRNDPCHCGSGKKYKKCCLK